MNSHKPDKYQVLPDLPTDQYEALKADIAEHGVTVAVEVDEFGQVLDGHNRVRVCRELGINDYPIVVRSGLTEEEKRIHARRINLLRRHLNREQVQQLIVEQIKETPSWSNNKIAKALGVDGKTIASARSDLEATSEIPKLERLTGTDGKARPSRRRHRNLQDDEALDDEDDEDLRPRGKRAEDQWDDPVKQAKMMHVADLVGMGADPNSEKVKSLIRHAAFAVIKSPPGTYNPFAGRSDEERREWHLFMLYLARRGGEPQGVARHVEWVLQRPFQNVAEWLGEEGDKFRKVYQMFPASDVMEQAWHTFLAEQAARTIPDIIAELETLEREFPAKLAAAREKR
jgi:ParB-like chromosome segregation protein Spo0J